MYRHTVDINKTKQKELCKQHKSKQFKMIDMRCKYSSWLTPSAGVLIIAQAHTPEIQLTLAPTITTVVIVSLAHLHGKYDVSMIASYHSVCVCVLLSFNELCCVCMETIRIVYACVALCLNWFGNSKLFDLHVSKFTSLLRL